MVEEKYPKYYQSLVAMEKTTNSRKPAEKLRLEQVMELNYMIERLLSKGKKRNEIREDIDIKPTVLYIWSAISGIIQVAERKKDSIGRNMDMGKKEYLDYSFRTFYQSLVRG